MEHSYSPNRGRARLAAYLTKINNVQSHATERCAAHNEFDITAIIPCTTVQATQHFTHAIRDFFDRRIFIVAVYGNLQKLAVSRNIQREVRRIRIRRIEYRAYYFRGRYRNR